jgi:hypothetical protein
VIIGAGRCDYTGPKNPFFQRFSVQSRGFFPVWVVKIPLSMEISNL